MSSRRRRSARIKSNRKNNNTNTIPPQIYNNKKNKEIMNKNNNNKNNNLDIPCLKLEEDDDGNNNSNNESDNELILKTPNFSLNHNKKPHQTDNNSIHVSEEEREEKEEGSTSVQLSYCRGLSKTPLAVPMVADINQQSVTRNDAKQITQTRLKRLKQLSSYSERLLSKDEKDEKKRIIRLEKNRRAAAMSRRKKKMYVKNLEEKTQLMARHLAISEMENAHLRALLHATQQQALPHSHSHSHSHLPLPPPIHSHHVQHFQTHFKLPHFAQMPTISTCSNSNSENITSSNSSAAVTNRNSVEPTNERNKQSASVGINEPCLKKRRLNDGSSMKNTNINTNINTNSNDSLSASCDTSISDISILEPLQSPPSPLLVGHGHGMSMGMTFGPGQSLLAPNLAQIHPSRLIPYHPCISYDHYDHDRAHLMRGPPQRQINNVDKIEAIVLDKDDDDNEQDGDDSIPPSVVVPRLSDEFINILDNDIISQGIDECGSII